MRALKQLVCRIGAMALMAVAIAICAVGQSQAAIVKQSDYEREQAAKRVAEMEALVEDLRQMPALNTGRAKGQARHALVIGIDDYEELVDLNKAVGDADSLQRTLEELGFAVTVKNNIAAREFDDAIDEFLAGLKRGDVAFFFFSGHGVSYEQRNFLLPADMPALDALRESRLDRYAIDTQDLVDRIYERGVEIALVVLDACRDNPFPPDPDTRSVRAYGGLQRMTPQKGAFVIYSAGVGQKALDRLGPEDADPNSVFTRIFRPALATPGMPVVEIAKRTQVEVSALATTVAHRQEPAYYDQVVGQFYMKPPQPRVYGLVVGIDDYGGLHNLMGAVNDTKRITVMLEQVHAEKVVTITNQDVRLNYIDYVWNDMVDEARPGDTLFFTYSGSGYREPNGTDIGDGLRAVLLLSGSKPVEAYARETETGARELDFNLIEPDRKLTDEIFTGWMEKAARKNLNVIVLIDGCHAGGLLLREFANVSFFGAVTEDKLAQERDFDGERYGIGSYVFSDAIRGGADLNRDGYLTQRELFAYGRQNLYNITSGDQDPQFFPAMERSSAELVLVRVPKQAGGDDLKRFWGGAIGTPPSPEGRAGQPER